MRIRYLLILLLAALICATGASAKTNLEWWQFWTDPGIKPTVDSLVQEFQAANPDISVNVTDLTWANGQEKIVVAFASGTAPDVLEIGSDWLGQLADAGHLANLAPQLAPDSAQFDGWKLVDYKGGLYGKPWILGTRVLFGNRDLLTQAGWDTNQIPTNWKALTVSAMSMRKLPGKVYGWGSNTAEKHRLYKKFLPFFWSNGAQLFTDDNKYCIISSDKAIAALNFYKQLHDSCGYVADQRGIEDAFLDGKVAFIISGDWLLKRIELEHRKLNFFTCLIPGPHFPGRSFLGAEVLAVNAHSDKKEAAVKFINFMTSAQNQVRFCKNNRSANPSSRQAQEDPYFTSNRDLQTFIHQIRSSVAPPVDPDWPAMEDAIEKAVEDALFGDHQVASALHKANLKIMELRNKRNGKP